jgi:titin
LTTEVIAATVPATPDPVVRSSSGETSIGIQWSAPDNGYNSITGYIIKSNGGSGSTFSEIGTTGPATTTFTETGLTNGQVYEFIVIAENEVGASEPSSPTALRVAVVPDAPGAPVKTFADGSTIEISWTAPSNNGGSVVTKYEIF